MHKTVRLTSLELLILGSFLLCVLTACFLWFRPSLVTTERERRQQDLAQELGVKIEDYPYRFSFPSSYFRVVLEPGMTIAEVHKIAQSYEQVLHCGETIEVYYYLSTNPEDSERVWLFYNGDGTFERLQSEDSDSGQLSTGGCTAGLLEE